MGIPAGGVNCHLSLAYISSLVREAKAREARLSKAGGDPITGCERAGRLRHCAAVNHNRLTHGEKLL